ALLEERDVLGADVNDADVRLRLEALDRASGAQTAIGDRVHRVRTVASQLMRQMRITPSPRDIDASGVLLALAYPDRIGQLRAVGSGRFLLRGGAGAALASPQSLSSSPFIVAAELDGRRPESRIFLAAPLSLEDLEAHFGEQITSETEIAWDDATRS